MNLQKRVAELLRDAETDMAKLKQLDTRAGRIRNGLTREEAQRAHTAMLQMELHVRACVLLNDLHGIDWENIGRPRNHVAEKLAGLEEDYLALQRAYQTYTKDMTQYFKMPIGDGHTM